MMTYSEFCRRFFGWGLLAAFSGIMFATLLYWYLQYRMGLWLDGPVVVAAGEPNTVIIVSEMLLLPGIAIWSAYEAISVLLSMNKQCHSHLWPDRKGKGSLLAPITRALQKGGEEVNSDPLDALLTAAEREAGLRLVEDADFVYLYLYKKPIATFNARTATIEEIRQVLAFLAPEAVVEVPRELPARQSGGRWRASEESREGSTQIVGSGNAS